MKNILWKYIMEDRKVLMQAGMHRYNHFGDWKYSCNDAELSQSSKYCIFGAVQGCPFSRKKKLMKGSRNANTR